MLAVELEGIDGDPALPDNINILHLRPCGGQLVQLVSSSSCGSHETPTVPVRAVCI